MTIKEDYKELKEEFSQSSALFKVLSAVGFFVSISSIATLADVIFQWKGFIQQALKTYEEYFVIPVTSLAKELGLSYQSEEVHAAILLSISVNYVMRLLSSGQKVAFKKINEKYGSKLEPNLTLYRSFEYLFPPCIWIWYGISEQTPNLLMVSLVVALYPFLLFGSKWLMVKIDKGEFYEKGEFNYFKKYYIYLAAIFLLIGVLGAINQGLTKSA